MINMVMQIMEILKNMKHIDLKEKEKLNKLLMKYNNLEVFPMLETDEDDEDLVGLSPEEALKLRQQKVEAAKERRKEYDAACAKADEILNAGDFAAAEEAFEKALALDNVATEASVGYWRAKTENFIKPDVLVGEYADASIESLEYDLGVDAVEIIKRDFKTELQKLFCC